MFRGRYNDIRGPQQHCHFSARKNRQQPNILLDPQSSDPTFRNRMTLHCHSGENDIWPSLGCKGRATEEGIVAYIASKPAGITHQRRVFWDIEATARFGVGLLYPEYFHLDTTTARQYDRWLVRVESKLSCQFEIAVAVAVKSIGAL